MTDFRERYKRLGFGRENINTNRILRSQRHDQFRRDMRSEYFSKHRDIDNENDTLDNEDEETVKIAQENKSKTEAKKNADTELQAAIQDRLLRLEKWREERSRQKLQEKKKAKPVFKVGIVHHRIYSPPLVKKATPLSSVRLCKSKEIRPEPTQKKVTRATEKRLAAKALSDQQKRENLRRKKKEFKDSAATNESEQILFASKDYEFTAPAGIMEIPMFGSQSSKLNKGDIQLQLNDLGESFKVSKSSNSYFNESNDDAEMLYEDENVDSHVTMDSSYIKLETSSISKRKSREHVGTDISENPLEQSKENRNSLRKLTPVAKMHTVDSSLDESAILKVSFDDADMLHVDENVDPHVNIHSNFIHVRNSSVNKIKSREDIKTDISENQIEQSKPKRKSLRFSTPAAKMHNTTFDEQLGCSDDKNVSVSINIQSPKKIMPTSATRRSTRRLKSNKIEKKTTFTPEVQKMQDNQEDIDIDSKNSNISTDYSYLEANKPKSTLGQRRSSHRFTDNSINSAKFENESSFILHYEDSVLSDEVPNTIQNLEVAHSFPVEDQEMTEVQEDNNLRISNIMDCSVSKLSKIKSLRRKKSIKFNNEGQKTVSDLQEESLIKFSPRSSMRLQNIKKSLEQSDQKEQSLIPNPNNLNESNILKRESQRISDMDKNEAHNLSLNKSIDKLPASFSPFIVMSRGKSSIRKEIQKRRFSKVSSDDVPTKDTIMQSLNISAEEEERTAQFYKYILNNEISRLNESCDKWNLIKEENTTPEDIRYDIQAAVGQTQLLIRKKFERFRSLVQDCETGKGEMLVTCKDLQGFWDMMYMEIKDCDSRFSRLEELKSNNWIGDDSEEIQKAVPPKKKVSRTNKSIVKKNATAAKTSSLRAHIMAARKKKTENKEAEKDLDTKVLVSDQTECLQIDNRMHNKSILSTPKNSSRRSSTTKSSNKRRSRKVEDSQDLKRTMEYCKMPEIQLDNSVIYINSERTPAKSILKSSKDESYTNSKSTNKVFFKEQPMEFVEFYDSGEETEERNTCLNNLEQPKEAVERRLNFEKELSFDASHINDGQNSEEAVKNITSSFTSLPYFNTTDNRMSSTPIVSVTPLNLEEKKLNISNTRKSGGTIKKQLSFKDTTPNTRVLRSNGFAPPLTPRPKLRNFVDEI